MERSSSLSTVSYTHLDVYKRQVLTSGRIRLVTALTGGRIRLTLSIVMTCLLYTSKVPKQSGVSAPYDAVRSDGICRGHFGGLAAQPVVRLPGERIYSVWKKRQKRKLKVG